MINYEGFFQSLQVMWMGMVGLFIFAGFVILMIFVLKFFMRKKDNTEN